MRLWSISPEYLDSKGLVALWREAILAKKVLEGRTAGYVHHPQLIRFKAQKDPIAAINSYLETVFLESKKRGYGFDESKIGKSRFSGTIQCTSGQLRYEIEHLSAKLKTRCPERLESIGDPHPILPNPIFSVIRGGVEAWERKKR
jgi:hypothetical protein